MDTGSLIGYAIVAFVFVWSLAFGERYRVAAVKRVRAHEDRLRRLVDSNEGWVLASREEARRIRGRVWPLRTWAWGRPAIRDLIRGQIDGFEFSIFRLGLSRSGGDWEAYYVWYTAALFESKAFNLPLFSLQRRPGHKTQGPRKKPYRGISLKDASVSRKYVLFGDEDAKAEEFYQRWKMQLSDAVLLAGTPWSIEGGPGWLLLYEKKAVASADTIPNFLSSARTLAEAFTGFDIGTGSTPLRH